MYDISPGYNDDEVAFLLSPHDWHPSSATHEWIADYVTTKIMAVPVH